MIQDSKHFSIMILRNLNLYLLMSLLTTLLILSNVSCSSVVITNNKYAFKSEYSYKIDTVISFFKDRIDVVKENKNSLKDNLFALHFDRDKNNGSCSFLIHTYNDLKYNYPNKIRGYIIVDSIPVFLSGDFKKVVNKSRASDKLDSNFFRKGREIQSNGYDIIEPEIQCLFYQYSIFDAKLITCYK